jgi:hypothetical protein
MARVLEQAITPNTVVIYGIGGGYEPGKFLFLLLDQLVSKGGRPNLYIPLSKDGLRRFLKNPMVEGDQISQSPPCKWTKLDSQLEESNPATELQHLTVLIIDGLHNPHKITRRSHLPQRCVEPR